MKQQLKKKFGLETEESVKINQVKEPAKLEASPGGDLNCRDQVAGAGEAGATVLAQMKSFVHGSMRLKDD